MACSAATALRKAAMRSADVVASRRWLKSAKLVAQRIAKARAYLEFLRRSAK
jgi:hypothetical protein